MWFIFPQLRGLGTSRFAHKYGISSLEEARAFLDHAVLGRRLEAAVRALEGLPETSADDVFGALDAMKLLQSDAFQRGRRGTALRSSSPTLVRYTARCSNDQANRGQLNHRAQTQTSK